MLDGLKMDMHIGVSEFEINTTGTDVYADGRLPSA
jgi:hypothetical protein